MAASTGGRVPFSIEQLRKWKPASVLDIGCSFGWVLGGLAGEVPRLVGVDADESALLSARENYPTVAFVHQTATELPFETGEFDAVVLSDVLEHLGPSDQPAVMAEARRVLRTGGLLVLTVPHTGVTAIMDPMDYKRRIPAVYRVYSRLTRHHPDTAQEIGHRHLSEARLDALMVPHFQLVSRQYGGLIEPFVTLIIVAMELSRIVPESVSGQLDRFRAWEGGLRYPRLLAYNTFVTARAV